MTTAMRKTLKAIFLIAITIGMAVAITTVTSFSSYQKQADQVQVIPNKPVLQLPSKRVSRFLVENSGENFLLHGRSLKPADHCHKDNEVCDIGFGANFTCCGNKCFDLTSDKSHCGACHDKCKFTYTCCRGQCVDINYDKRHCGGCGQKCLHGQYCIYGMCDYA